MRKFYLFTLALLSAVGAWAQETVYALTGVGSTAITTLTNGGTYVIKCYGQAQTPQRTWMYDNGNGGVKGTNQAECPTGIDAQRYVWRVTTTDGGTTYKFTNLLTNKQLTFNGNYNGSSVSTSDNGTVITIDVSGENVGLKNSNGQYVDMGSEGTSAETWSGGVSGSRRMTIYEAILTPTEDYAKVVYNYHLEGGTTRKTSNPVIVDLDAPYPAATGLPRGVTATLPEGTVSLEGAEGHVVTKDVLCTQDLPFTTGVYYNIKMHSNFPRFLKANGKEIAYGDRRILNYNEEDNYLWKFEGDAFGIKMISKNGKVVKSSGSGNATLSENSEDATEFELSASAANAAWFCLKHIGSNNYLNAQNGKVNHWSANDAGSSMNVFNVTVDDAFNEIKNTAKFSILAGSVVQGPQEFASPVDINSAIDAAQLVDDSRDAKIAFMNDTQGQQVIDYLNDRDENGSLANIQFTMQAQYGTLIMPCPSRALTDLKTYKCSAVGEDNVVTLTPNGTNAEGALEQNVPYIIEATPGSKFTIIGWDKGSRGTHKQGYLTGVLTNDGANISVDSGSSYVLAKKEGKVGFFKVTGDAVKCPQYKCYLTVPTSAPASGARAFYFSSDDVETGINAVEIEEATPANAVIYDLSGRRVQSAKSGLYIVNGKKVIK